jgi:hypothetical protein
MTTVQQPNTERIPLAGHKPLSHTTIHGWPAILCGVIFLIVGSPILAIGMGWMDYPKSSIHAPLWVIGVVGGLWSLAHTPWRQRPTPSMEYGTWETATS